MSATATIWTTVRLEGLHHWPKAPGRLDYLRFPHRHLFHVRAETTVKHDKREVSFEDLRDALLGAWPGRELGERSCETIARELAEALARRFGRSVAVTVSEDGESGARVIVRAP